MCNHISQFNGKHYTIMVHLYGQYMLVTLFLLHNSIFSPSNMKDVWVWNGDKDTFCLRIFQFSDCNCDLPSKVTDYGNSLTNIATDPVLLELPIY